MSGMTRNQIRDKGLQSSQSLFILMLGKKGRKERKGGIEGRRAKKEGRGTEGGREEERRAGISKIYQYKNHLGCIFAF